MNYQVVIEDGPRADALRIARERCNLENTGTPGFTLLKDDQAFVQMLVDEASSRFVQQYLSAPQNMAEALARIAQVESERDALKARVEAADVTLEQPSTGTVIPP